MAMLREIVFDCHHPARLARFWVAVLDDFAVRPYDEEDIAQLADRGLTPETDTNVMVDGPGLKLCFQKANTPVVGKNKLHIDVVSDVRADLVRQLCAIGAVLVEDFTGSSWLRDPEGNDFCIADPR